MDEFTRNLDDLLYLSAKKYNLVTHLKKNYKENIHYIIKKHKVRCSPRADKIKMLFYLHFYFYGIIIFNIREKY